MRVVILAVAITFAMTVSGTALAVIPANPRTIAGIDGIDPDSLGKVLSKFCQKNGCESKLDWHENGNYNWNLYWRDGRSPASVGGVCIRIHHQYCVQTHGEVGEAFMSPARTKQLKELLEAKGAKVVLMDCSIEPTDHGFDYVCTNGEPPP